MSVIWIINQYGGIPRVGIQGRHYQFASRFSKLGHEVTLFSAKYHHHKRYDAASTDVKREKPMPGFEVVWLNSINYKSANSILRFINWFVFAINLLFFRPRDLKKPDLIYYSSLSLIGSIAAEILSKYYRIPYIYEERDIWPLTLVEIKSVSRRNPIVVFLNMIQSRAYRNADLVISPLPGLRNYIRSKKIQENDFLWVPNGCTDVEKNTINLQENNISKLIKRSKFSVGYVGSFGRANRIDVLLRAAQIIQDKSDVQFFLFGSGALIDEHKKFVSDNGLRNVHFLGTVDRSFVPEIYRLVDVCYLGWGDYKMYDFGVSANKLSEYMFHGKPVLHSYSGGYDFVSMSGGGLTVPVCDPKLVADALLKFENLPRSELTNIGLNGMQFATKNFDYDIIFDNLIRKLKEKSWVR